MIYLYRIGPQLDRINMVWRERIDACAQPLVPSGVFAGRLPTTRAYLQRRYGKRRTRGLIALAEAQPGKVAQMVRTWEASE